MGVFTWSKAKLLKLFLLFMLSILGLSLMFTNCSPMQFSSVEAPSVAGIELVDAASLDVLCTDGEKKACNDITGIGFQTCLQGVFQVCEVNSCFSDFIWNSSKKICEAKMCKPGDQIACSVFNELGVKIGSGTKICDAYGNYPAVCEPSSCVDSYYLDSVTKKCLPKSCNNGDMKPCTTAFGTGVHYCANYQWPKACTLTQCADPVSHDLVNGQCVPKIVKVCSPGSQQPCSDTTIGGTGYKLCNELGTGYGSCLITSCDAAKGYIFKDGTCVTACTPNSTQICSIANGLGEKACSSDGKIWGLCKVTQCNSGYIADTGSTACLDSAIPSCTLSFNPTSVSAGGNATASVINGSHINAAGNNSINCDNGFGTVKALSRLLTNIVSKTSCTATVINQAGSHTATCSNTVAVVNSGTIETTGSTPTTTATATGNTTTANQGLTHTFNITSISNGPPNQYNTKASIDFNQEDLDSLVHIYVVALKAGGNSIQGIPSGWCYKNISGQAKWVLIDTDNNGSISNAEFAACSFRGAVTPRTVLGSNQYLALYDLQNQDFAMLGNLTVYIGYGKGYASATAFDELINYTSQSNPYGRYLNVNTLPYQGHLVSLTGLNGASTGPLTDYELQASIYVRSENYAQQGYYFAYATGGGKEYHAYKNSSGVIVWQELVGGLASLGNNNAYLMKSSADGLKNQVVILSDGTTATKTDWSSLAGYSVYFGYGIGSTPYAAAQYMLANKLYNSAAHVLQSSASSTTPSGKGDFKLSGTISGTSLASAKFTSSVTVDSAHLAQNGAYFLVAILDGQWYCFQSNSTWIACSESAPKSYSGTNVVKLDPDGVQSTIVQHILTGDFIPYGGAKVYLGYGVGSSIQTAFSEMMSYKSSTYQGRWNLIHTVGYTPDFLKISGPNGGSAGTAITALNVYAIVQPEFQLDTAHRFYGKMGYRFVLVKHKGRDFFRVNNQTTSFIARTTSDYTGKSYDGRVALTYFNQQIFKGNATGFAGATVYVAYGVGSNETEAANWAISNNKFSSMILPTASATIDYAKLGVTGNETNTVIPLNGSATIKFKVRDGKSADLQCLNPSTNVYDSIHKWDLSSVIDEEQSYTQSSLTKGYTCKLVVTGVNGQNTTKTGLNFTIAPPTVDTLSVNKTTINAGERLTFSWTTSNATSVTAFLNGSSVDMTPYGVDGRILDVEGVSGKVDLKASTASATSTVKSVTITVNGSLCSIAAYAGTQCRYGNDASKGLTKDGKNAWYKAVCLYQSNYYRCDGGATWTKVSGY